MSSIDRDMRGPRAGIVRALLLAMALCAPLAASASAAAPNWLEPADLSQSGRNASNPEVAMDAAGDTIAIWEREAAGFPSHNLQISTRAAGETFTSPSDLVISAEEARLAMTPSGEAVAIWRKNPTGKYIIQAATRPPGGSFSVPVTLYTVPVAGMIPQDLELAVGDGGDVAVTWNVADPNGAFKGMNPSFVLASVRPAGGSFTPPETDFDAATPPARGRERRRKGSVGRSRSHQDGGRGESQLSTRSGDAVVSRLVFRRGTLPFVQSVIREAGKDLTTPMPVSGSGKDAGLADIDVERGAGNAIAGLAPG